MKKIIILISIGLIITSCVSSKSKTDEIFVGLWKCNSIVGTDKNGKDLGVSEFLTKYDGTIKKIENTDEGYYFFLGDEIYTLAKKDENTLSGDGLTLVFNKETQKLVGKHSTYINISDETYYWVYEFYKQK